MIANSPAAVAAAFSSSSSPVAPATAAGRRCPSRSPPRPGMRCPAARPAAAATVPRQSPAGPGSGQGAAGAGRLYERVSSAASIDRYLCSCRQLASLNRCRQDRGMSMQAGRTTLELIPSAGPEGGCLLDPAGPRAGQRGRRRGPGAGIRALGDPVRLRLVSLIGAHQGGEACVCELTSVRPHPAHHQPPPEGPAAQRGSSTASAAEPGSTTGSCPPRWNAWPRCCRRPAAGSGSAGWGPAGRAGRAEGSVSRGCGPGSSSSRPGGQASSSAAPVSAQHRAPGARQSRRWRCRPAPCRSPTGSPFGGALDPELVLLGVAAGRIAARQLTPGRA